MTNYTQRFETIGDLYYRRHHRLRPGKSEAAATGRDSSSDENHALFEEFCATNLFGDALDRIADLEKSVKELQEGN